MMIHVTVFFLQGYIPSKEDVLHAHNYATDIDEYIMNIKGVPFRFLDKGRNRSQQRKWTRYYEEITSILFLVPSSAFDQTIPETNYNYILESIEIFYSIVNRPFYRSVSFILFFNKTDLLKEKVKVKSITDCFTDFKVLGYVPLVMVS